MTRPWSTALSALSALSIMALLFGATSSAHAQQPADASAKQPALTAQTKDRKSSVKETATSQSILDSIENQKMVLELEDRNSKGYPLQVVALADFYWDLAEWYGLQAFSETVEKPIYEAEEAKDAAAVKRYKAIQQDYLSKKKAFQDETITRYKLVIRDFPRSEKLDEVRYYLAYNLNEMGRTEEAVDVYTELLGAHPNSPFKPDAIVNIGEYYFENNDFENARRLYLEVEAFPESGVYGYALYKQAWCFYNLTQYKRALSQFIKVIKDAEARALAGTRGAIALKREAQNDMVLPYSKVGRAGDAIRFLKKYAPVRYLSLASRLAGIYTEQNEFLRSTKLLRALIQEARKGAIAGKDRSYMVLQFQRQIVNNARKPGDKEATVAEIGELIRIWEETQTGAPAEFIAKERAQIKRLILEVAAGYHQEYNETLEVQTLGYTQRLYDEYLRVFRHDENAYQISMNNGLLLLATEKYEEAAAEFEKVISMKPDGEYADNAAERAVIAYLKTIQIRNQKMKTEELADLRKTDLSPEDQRFVNAIDRWMDLIARKGPNAQTAKNIPTARFAAAKVLYNANHFADSAKRFLKFIEKHPKHGLVNDARRHVLSCYNLNHDVEQLRNYANAFDAIPTLPGDLKADIATIKNEFNFQECFKYEKQEAFNDAAECFKKYAAEFPKGERAPAAIYNAGINYFKARKVELALETQLNLYKKYRRHELAPKALYSMAEMFRQTTVYDQAAIVYESFVKNHKKHPLAEKALRYASIFRKTLGNYKQAISDLNLWLARYGKTKDGVNPIAPRVHLDIITILEKQGKYSKVVKTVGKHIKLYPKEPGDIRLQVMNKRAKALRVLKKYRQARDQFGATVEAFRQLSDTESGNLSLPAISAVAEAHFNLGEYELLEAKRIKLTSPSEKKVKKNLEAKLTQMAKAKVIYQQVIAYGHPGWVIAASTQLGSAYEDLADAVENVPVPRKIRHLPEVVDQYIQDMAERADSIRKAAITSYKKAMAEAKKEHWFNKYSERAEAAVARLDLNDVSVKEFRLRPDQIAPNSGEHSTNDAQLRALKQNAVAKSTGDSWFAVGRAELSRGQIDAAIAAWNKALSLEPGHLPSKASIAATKLHGLGHAAALAELEAIIKESRFQAEARNALAAEALGRDEYEAAVKHSRNVLLGDPDNVNAYLNAAIAYYRQGLYDQAGLIAESALEQVPTAAAMENVLGLVALSNDDTRSATLRFNKALKSDTGNLQALMNLAALELAYGNFAPALTQYDKVISLVHGVRGVQMSRAVALRGLGRFDEAAAGYEATLKKEPSDPEPEYNLCVLHHQFTNDWAAAKRWCGTYMGHIERKHPKFREVKRRVKAIAATMKAMEAARRHKTPETP